MLFRPKSPFLLSQESTGTEWRNLPHELIKPLRTCHGELLREGYDEKLIVDPDNLNFLFQGVPTATAPEKTTAKYPGDWEYSNPPARPTHLLTNTILWLHLN
jgi:hypothetical protein